MAKKPKNRKPLIQFTEYIISGGAYFWVGYVLLIYLNNLFLHQYHWTKKTSLWWATIISNLVGWTVNFILQRFWVFNSKNLNKHKTQVTGRYIFITLLDFVMNYFILLGLVNIGIAVQFGQFISSAFFTAWNWFWYKFWVFPEHMKKHHTAVTPLRIAAHRAHGHAGYHRMSK